MRGAGKPPVGDTRRLLGTDPTFRPLTLRSNRWSPPTCCKDARRARRPDGDVLGADSSARGRPPPAPQPNSWASQPFWGSLVTAPEVVNGATSPTSSLGGTSPAVSSGGGGGGGGGGAPPAPPSHGGAALGGLAHGKLESFWSGGGDATCCGSDAAVGPGICWMMACVGHLSAPALASHQGHTAPAALSLRIEGVHQLAAVPNQPAAASPSPASASSAMPASGQPLGFRCPACAHTTIRTRRRMPGGIGKLGHIQSFAPWGCFWRGSTRCSADRRVRNGDALWAVRAPVHDSLQGTGIRGLGRGIATCR